MVAVQRLRWICSCALSDGAPRRSFNVAVVVGTILNIINQGDAFLVHASINWFKIILTYLVPYGVCTYGAVSAASRNRATDDKELASAHPDRGTGRTQI
jgi:hypothetical protein